MRIPARSFWIVILAVLAGYPCRGSISVTWLDEPTVLWSWSGSQYEPLDLNSDSIIDFMFGADITNHFLMVSRSARIAEVASWIGTAAPDIQP